MKQSKHKLIKSLLMLVVVLFASALLLSMKSKNNFLKDIGVCTKVVNNAMWAGYGYSFVEESVQGFLIPQKSEDEFNEQLSVCKMSKLPVYACNSFLPGSLKCIGENAVHPEIIEYAETTFRRAKMAGTRIIVFGSGGSRKIPEGFSVAKARQQFVNLCKQLGPLAAQYDIIIVIEPLNKRECNFINTVAEGGEIVKDVNHPNVQLLADIYHMKMDDEGPGNILKYGKYLRHVHIAEKEERAAPGTHGEDFRPYFEALKKAKYKGSISIECRWANIENQGMTAIKAIQEQI